MHINSLQLINFRCFSSFSINFNSPVILITGPNGSGKTSILEALHFACYLRSFKTHIAKELIYNVEQGFSITASVVAPHALDSLQVQLTRKKRLVKLNQKPIHSFKELYTIYKAITITEDDLSIVRGAPSLRRNFIDQMLALQEPSYPSLLRKYRQIVDNRNALLSHYKFDQESYHLWTDQLLKASKTIQNLRISLLKHLEEEAKIIAQDILTEKYTIEIAYNYARPYTKAFESTTSQELFEHNPLLLDQEKLQKRSLIGAHLDDFSLVFQQKESKTYASRGQQKLIVFLLKVAQAKLLQTSEIIFLIDDFMADIDESKASALLNALLRYSSQLIMTSAFVPDFLTKQLENLPSQHISILPQNPDI